MLEIGDKMVFQITGRVVADLTEGFGPKCYRIHVDDYESASVSFIFPSDFIMAIHDPKVFEKEKSNVKA